MKPLIGAESSKGVGLVRGEADELRLMRLNQGKKALAMNDFAGARTHFQWVLNRNPNELAALVGLRLVYRKIQN